MMEKEGLWVRISFPNSTIGTRWPIPEDGYRIKAIAVASTGGCMKAYDGAWNPRIWLSYPFARADLTRRISRPVDGDADPALVVGGGGVGGGRREAWGGALGFNGGERWCELTISFAAAGGYGGGDWMEDEGRRER
ncbi:hypothetical protein Vadar_020474 [Vaccinium darrowii]|uniref:Uncharacterized protein n=1 Tax=Vaccinium darrowii TaxID=229202 RepID=A0ACB7YN49_9ERIC|nr:hypothetical protein Vadar_020474 [Vaccinium darrowii]